MRMLVEMFIQCNIISIRGILGEWLPPEFCDQRLLHSERQYGIHCLKETKYLLLHFHCELVSKHINVGSSSPPPCLLLHVPAMLLICLPLFGSGRFVIFYADMHYFFDIDLDKPLKGELLPSYEKCHVWYLVFHYKQLQSGPCYTHSLLSLFSPAQHMLLKAFWTENKHLNSWLLLKCHQNPYLSSDCTCKAEWRSFISTLWFARPAIVNHGGQITTPGTLWPMLWTVCGVYSHKILIAICVLVILQLLWQRSKRNIVLIDCGVKIKYWQIVKTKRLL